MKKLFVLFVLLILINNSNGARILGIIPTPSYSHQVPFQPLWRELSLRGHKVTVITTNPVNDLTLTNLTEIDVSFSFKILKNRVLEILENRDSFFKCVNVLVDTFHTAYDKQLEHPLVNRLITDPDVQFDLVIFEYLALIPIAFAKKFNCPSIGVSSIDTINLLHAYMGNSHHYVSYPNLFVGKESNLSLLERVYSTLFDLILHHYGNWFFRPMYQKTIDKHFGDGYHLQALIDDMSLMFVNSDSVFHLLRAVTPKTIPIGGKLMRLPSSPLPKDLQDVLDKAKNGFIYFSMGSHLNSIDLEKKTVKVIVETFKELPYTVLWKDKLEEVSNKPDNVIVYEWFPQIEVLRHSNLKLFITHGGMQSVEEAISARVPILGIPYINDQSYNINRMVNRGCALSINYKTLEKNSFKKIILELINNHAYRKQIEKMADLVEDQPNTGLERAVWWTEYVLRHNGTRHFNDPLLHMPWYQYYYLDVIVVVATTLLIVTSFLVFILRTVFVTIFGQNKKAKSQ